MEAAMCDPDGDGQRILPRWRVAHDALHEDTMALAGLLTDKERVRAKLDVLDSHADRLGTREEKLRLVESERESFVEEGSAVLRLVDEVGAAREAALADYRAGREDAERRALAAERELGLSAESGERESVIRHLEAEVAAGAAAFDEHYTTVFLRLHDQVRSWLEHYDPSGALRAALGGGGDGV
jgi:hypothetical protein